MSSVEDLRGLANSLNKATDDLNRVLENTEKEIRDLNLGVTAWSSVPLSAEGYLSLYYLGWDITMFKGNYAWCLATRKKDEFSSKPVLEQGREIRAAAALGIENVLKALRIEAEKTLEMVAKGAHASSKVGG